MTTLKLAARLSYIDTGASTARAHFVFDTDDSESRDKLDRACPRGNARMHTREGFYIPVKQDISEFIGMDCEVRVKVSSYKLKSTYEANRGETITGFKLSLVNIELDPKYQ